MDLQNASWFYIWSLTEGCFDTILKIALLFETDCYSNSRFNILYQKRSRCLNAQHLCCLSLDKVFYKLIIKSQKVSFFQTKTFFGTFHSGFYFHLFKFLKCVFPLGTSKMCCVYGAVYCCVGGQEAMLFQQWQPFPILHP